MEMGDQGIILFRWHNHGSEKVTAEVREVRRLAKSSEGAVCWALQCAASRSPWHTRKGGLPPRQLQPHCRSFCELGGKERHTALFCLKSLWEPTRKTIHNEVTKRLLCAVTVGAALVIFWGGTGLTSSLEAHWVYALGGWTHTKKPNS